MVISMPVLVEYGYVAILMCLPCFHIYEARGMGDKNGRLTQEIFGVTKAFEGQLPAYYAVACLAEGRD